MKQKSRYIPHADLFVAFTLEHGNNRCVALGGGRLFGRAFLRVLRGLEIALLLLQRVGLAQLVVLMTGGRGGTGRAEEK